MSLKPLTIAQFSDCHLFADKNAEHFGANVWQNLLLVLANIATKENIDCAVFTGDLTQDHSETSYQHFVEAVAQAQLAIPVYFLAGNHDDRALLTSHLIAPTFQTNKSFGNDFWQVQLLDSKSDTPSGVISSKSLDVLTQQIDQRKFQLLMMHHHPLNIGYYIDQHGLKNQDFFWKTITQLNSTTKNIKAIACGHVHRASQLSKQGVAIDTCPATSIQFGETKEQAGSIVPSYRILYLEADGTINSDVVTP